MANKEIKDGLACWNEHMGITGETIGSGLKDKPEVKKVVATKVEIAKKAVEPKYDGRGLA